MEGKEGELTTIYLYIYHDAQRKESAKVGTSD